MRVDVNECAHERQCVLAEPRLSGSCQIQIQGGKSYGLAQRKRMIRK